MTAELTETTRAELEKQDAELAAAGLANIDKSSLILPIVKLTQQLSHEVTDGKTESGHWYNSLTGDDYGEQIEAVLAWYYKGRFYAPDNDERSYSAASEVVPAHWPEEFVGKNFADIPQAEEQHKARANDPEDEFQWGSGPEIETTHNFIGFLVNDPGVPIRISLKSTSTPAAEKIKTLASFAGSFWISSYRLTAVGRSNKQGKPYFVAEAQKGEQTTDDQRAAAREIANGMKNAQFALVGDTPEPDAKKPEAKKPSGAADVV